MTEPLRRAALVALAFMLGLAATPVGATVLPPSRPGQCGVVHGRMSFANGTFSYRIWVIGTHRMLRVLDAKGLHLDDTDALPEPLATRLRPYRKDVWGQDIFADFKVCAVTPTRPGVMQSVTIAGASKVRIVATPVP